MKASWYDLGKLNFHCSSLCLTMDKSQKSFTTSENSSFALEVSFSARRKQECL